MDVNGAECQPLPTKEQSTLEKVLAMGQGDGEGSYSKNSGLQKSLNRLPLSALNDALERVTLPVDESDQRPCRVAIADLGCSSGPNTIDNVALIVDKLRHRFGPSRKDIQFQTYFNDLPSNDFNNLFSLLSSDSRAENFYSAGVPGSFFHRLFPTSSVHVFFSSWCLHWLSRIPESLLDADSPAFNGGYPWVVHSRTAVAKSFQQQAALDLKAFLLARADELVSGGLLFFVCLGRVTSEPSDPSNCSIHEFQDDLNEVWTELIGEGLLTEQQRDAFNVPFYHRSTADVREAIADCGDSFHELTVGMETIDLRYADIHGSSEATVLAKKIKGTYLALWNYLLEILVGKDAPDVIWQRYEKLVERRIRLSPEHATFRGHMCCVALIRK